MNDYRAYVESNYNSIYHHGIKGQEWGVRRFQNPDGSLTPEGRRRYSQNFYNELKTATKGYLSGNDKEVAEIARRNIGNRITDEQFKKLKASEDKFYKSKDKNWTYDKEASRTTNGIINNIKKNMSDDDINRVKKNYLEYAKKEYGSDPKVLGEVFDKSIKNRSKNSKTIDDLGKNRTFFEAIVRDPKISKMYWDEVAKAKADYDKKYASEQKLYSDNWKELVNTKKEIINDVLGTYANKKLYSIYDKDTIADILAGSSPSLGFYIDTETLKRQRGA